MNHKQLKKQFFITEFSISRVIPHLFNINDFFDACIGYEMVICHNLMVQPGPIKKFNRKFLEWEKSIAPTKYPGNFLGKPNITKSKI